MYLNTGENLHLLDSANTDPGKIIPITTEIASFSKGNGSKEDSHFGTPHLGTQVYLMEEEAISRGPHRTTGNQKPARAASPQPHEKGAGIRPPSLFPPPLRNVLLLRTGAAGRRKLPRKASQVHLLFSSTDSGNSLSPVTCKGNREWLSSDGRRHSGPTPSAWGAAIHAPA